MKNLRKLGNTVVLTLALGLFAFAGETRTLACGSPDPGQIDTPPCAMAQAPTPDDTVPGQVDTPPAARVDPSLTEIAANVIFGIASLF